MQLPQFKIVLIYCRARSGSYFVHSLFDGHPDVLSLPPLKTTRLFFHSSNTYWNKGGQPRMPLDELVRAFVKSNPTLFDARGCAGGQGYDHMGEDGSTVLRVDPDTFSNQLFKILEKPSEELNRRRFFVAVHQAYDFAVYGNDRQAGTIVYQAHNPLDDLGNESLLFDFPEAKLLLTMQEAARSLVSLIYQKDANGIDKIGPSGRYLLCIMATVYGWRALVGRVAHSRQLISCMNALNKDLEAESRRYCEFAELEWNPQMMVSTFNGIRWNGDDWSKLPVSEGRSSEAVREERTAAVLYRKDHLVLRALTSDVREVCCFYSIPLHHYVVAFLAIPLPMKVEVIGIHASLGSHSASLFWRAVYFYLRRVVFSYKWFLTAVFWPSSK